ncbi:hypothetical protein, partial [Klebsiella pneumoniae]|uniref:hypothetical protein n=1 Tax=Klebsiella pneumoniae TaxID=573 RepID=UPI001C55F07A
MKPGTHSIDVDTTRNIEQGYLILGGNKHLRVRIIDDLSAFIAFKIGAGIERNEYEYQVPIEDAREMMSIA